MIVEHKSDIGLVNAHPEGIGGNDHTGAVIYEVLLAPPPRVGTHAGMVSPYGKPGIFQPEIQLIHRFSRGTVNDPALPAVLCQIPAHPLLLISGPLHLKIKIWPVKPGYRLTGADQLKGGQDILPDLLCSRGREGRDHRPQGKLADKGAYPYIAGSEVLSPLGNAVGLIHSDHGYLRMAGEIQESPRFQPLRRHIDELVPPLLRQLQRPGRLPLRERAVDIGRMHSRLIECLYLVHHQRDERRDNYRRSRQEEGRQLVADGFPCPSGHDSQHVPSREDLVYDLLLAGTKGVVSKICF